MGGLWVQILTRLSEPPVAIRRTGPCCWEPCCAESNDPGTWLGAQDTELAPSWPCATKFTWLKVLFSNVSTDTVPSELAAAKWQPASGGDQATRLTEAVCRVNS